MKARLFLLFMLCAFWLVPFYLAGAMIHYPTRLYTRLAVQYTAAGLFTRRIPVWNQSHIQVQSKGAADWKTVDTKELSPMGAFGTRQRLDRILLDTGGRPVGAAVQKRLAEWVAREYAKLHPSEGNVLAVRFVQTTWTSNTPEMATPSGEWVPHPAEMDPKIPLRVMASFGISQGCAEPNPPVPTMGTQRIPEKFQRRPKQPDAAPSKSAPLPGTSTSGTSTPGTSTPGTSTSGTSTSVTPTRP